MSRATFARSQLHMHRAERLRARSGAALVFALLLLVVLDCVVLGTLHIALLERRTADNAGAALRLRFAAESAVRSAMARWPAALDTITAHASPIAAAAGVTADGYPYEATIERI